MIDLNYIINKLYKILRKTIATVFVMALLLYGGATTLKQFVVLTTIAYYLSRVCLGVCVASLLVALVLVFLVVKRDSNEEYYEEDSED